MSKLKIILLVAILLISSMPLMTSMNVVASPPASGDKAFANSTVSYSSGSLYTTTPTTFTANPIGNSGSWTMVGIMKVLTNITAGTNPNGVAVSSSNLYVADYGSGNVSVIGLSNNTNWKTITVGSRPDAVAVSSSNLYVVNKVSGTVSVIGISNNTVWKTITVGTNPDGVAVSSSNAYVANGGSNTVSVISTSWSGFPAVQESFTIPTNTQTYTLSISSPQPVNLTYNSLTESSVTSYTFAGSLSILSISVQPLGSISSSVTSFSVSWSEKVSIKYIETFTIPANMTSYTLNWSAQQNTNTTYNGVTQSVATSGYFTGSMSVTTVDFVNDYFTASYTISYWLYENTKHSELYSYPTATNSYNINSYQTHIGEFWNSSTISFSFTLPSNASTSYSASYKVLISNLTIALPSSTYISFVLSAQNFTYYSLVKYKSTYNITAYKNFTTAQTATVVFTTSELINDNPSYSYLSLHYSGHGSTEILAVNATNPFKNESVQITNLNWGDGSPTVSSSVEYPAGTYYNFSFSHQYTSTGTFTVTFLIVNAAGAASSLSVSESTSITLTLTISTTSNALPVKTDSYIYFNYTQTNLNLQNVFLYVNNILVLAQNVSSNTNYGGSVAYAVPYYSTATATFTAKWEYNGGGISGTDIIQYAVANKVPTVGKWIILNYTIGTGATATKESVPYFYSQAISYNVSWSYFVWQVFLPSNAVNITITGSPVWKSPVISVPASFNTTTATFKLLENITTFQVTWLAPNPVGNALIVIQYYPQSAIFGEFGVNIPFNQFNTFLNGKQIYSPTQQVNLGQAITINTTTAYGILISSYSTTVTVQTQFLEIPLNIVPLTIANLNSSYVIGFTVTQHNITQEGQYMMPLETQTFYIPAGTYNFSFTYLNFNSYTVVKYLNLSMTISGVSYFLITGVTLTNINTHLSTVQNNVTTLIEDVNISLSNSNSNIKNQIIHLSLNVTNTNSTISKQLIVENNSLNNINTKITDDVNTILTDLSNQNSTVSSQFLNITTRIKNMNVSMLDQFVNISADIKNLNSSAASQFLNVLKNIKNLNETVMNEVTTNYYTLKFEDYAAINSTTLQVTIYSFRLNGTPTNLSLTQAIAKNLTLYYINSDNSTTLHYTIVSVSAGVMVIQIHTNIQTEMQLMSGQSVLGAKTYVVPSNSNNTALQGNALATNFYLSGLSSYLFVLDYHLFNPIFYKINLWLIIIFLLVISVPITINRKTVKKNIALKHSLIALYTFLFGTMVILYLMYLHGVV